MFHVITCAVLLVATVCIRVYCILPKPTVPERPKKSAENRTLAVFLGSGGHTSEMLALVSSLDFDRYFPRIYIISEGDTLSERKAAALEATKAASSHSTSKNPDAYTFLVIPRARKVHQSLLTTPSTALLSVTKSFYQVALASSHRKGQFADVLVLNGPGTCLTLCLAVYLNKFFGLASPKMVYIESFARVQTLSLSGKLLRSLVDRFVVQWPQLLQDGKRGEYHGWLI
ncbi:MAG: glycosyltransferase family 1 protein [Lentinula lateritia]|uniref:UDP-N-acetylglucosamine transferase subunit ALG14 n=1 Tax=Lentinula lateritia TaxID=40482 RepID=A0ABQ8VL25_9AGAR|nr:MAG: glycosyltransferase family 1 protein [Lentinula lateritia]KAJ4497075.1 glycosyltransferase family 1 protein [Lentinula lateritia]